MALEEFRRDSRVISHANDDIGRVVMAKEGDVSGRTLRIQITDDGVVEDLSAVKLMLAWKSEDGTHMGIEPFTMVDGATGTWELAYPEAMLVPGTVRAYLQIVGDGFTVNGRTFDIVVEDDLGITGGASGEPMFGTIISTIAEFYDLINRGETQLADQKKRFDDIVDNIEEIVGVVPIGDDEINALFQGW